MTRSGRTQRRGDLEQASLRKAQASIARNEQTLGAIADMVIIDARSRQADDYPDIAVERSPQPNRQNPTSTAWADQRLLGLKLPILFFALLVSGVVAGVLVGWLSYGTALYRYISGQ